MICCFKFQRLFKQYCRLPKLKRECLHVILSPSSTPAMHPLAFLYNNQAPVVPATAPLVVEDLEKAMAINASINSTLQEIPPLLDAHPSSEVSSSTLVGIAM